MEHGQKWNFKLKNRRSLGIRHWKNMQYKGRHEVRGGGWSEPRQLKTRSPGYPFACLEDSAAVFWGATQWGHAMKSDRGGGWGHAGQPGERPHLIGSDYLKPWLIGQHSRKVRVAMDTAVWHPCPVGTNCSLCYLDLLVALPSGCSGSTTYG